MPVVPLSLTHVRDEHLAAAQLKLVVAQVRHERVLAASDARKALAIQEHLRTWFSAPISIGMPGLVIRSGPDGAQVDATQSEVTGWQFRSEAGDWTATVTPDFFSLETVSYTSWSEFTERLTCLTGAVAEELDPALEQRLGLRFVDELRVTDVEVAADWTDRIAPSFLGPAADARLAKSVRGMQQAVEFEGPKEARVTLRHGTVVSTDGRPAYLLDHDCYVLAGRRFDVEVILDAFGELHTLALGVFQLAITESFYNQLREGERG